MISQLHAEHQQRLVQIFHLLLAHRFKNESEFFLDLFGHLAGNIDATWLGNLLKPRRYVDAFAIAILSVHDNLAQVDTDAHVYALRLLNSFIALGQSPLKRDGAFDSIDNAGKLSQQAVAHHLEHAPMVAGYLRLEKFFPARPQAFEGPGLVALHKSRIPDYVGRENCRELPLHGKALRTGATFRDATQVDK